MLHRRYPIKTKSGGRPRSPRYQHSNQAAHPINALLSKMGWSEAELARRCHTTRSTVNRVKNGDIVYPGGLLTGMLFAHSRGRLGFDPWEFINDVLAWVSSDPEFIEVFDYHRQRYDLMEEWRAWRAEESATEG